MILLKGLRKIHARISLALDSQPTRRKSPPAYKFPIRLVLKSAEGPATAVQPVQEWRVERENGGVFLIASRVDFTGDLPIGTYNITAPLRVADGTLRTVRGQLEIKPDGSSQRGAAFVSPVR